MPLRTIPLVVVIATLIASIVSGPSVVADDVSNYGTVRISDRNQQTSYENSYYDSSSNGSYESTGGEIIYSEGDYFGGGYYGAYASPALQFGPLQNIPDNRTFNYYRRYYPQRWYGQTGSRRPAYAPMVYHPTDTTQLGYYYQHVPVWQPNPRMLPEPNPATWHNWGQLPAEMVFHREGKGLPKGIVNPYGAMGTLSDPQSYSSQSAPIQNYQSEQYQSEQYQPEQYQPEESIRQKQPLPLQPKRLVPPMPKPVPPTPAAQSILNELR